MLRHGNKMMGNIPVMGSGSDSVTQNNVMSDTTNKHLNS